MLWATTMCAASATGSVTSVARADEFWNTRDLLAQQFHGSERVTYVHVAPKGAERARIEARIGRALPKTSYTFFVATTHGKIDGYALFDEQVGQHEPISFATFFDADGRVSRVEVVAYREPYGDGIRAERFRKQFVGRSASSHFRSGEDIDAVSGATISSRSMCIGVERATALFEETIAKTATPALASR
jgi:electron transport complex protein RnfG